MMPSAFLAPAEKKTLNGGRRKRPTLNVQRSTSNGRGRKRPTLKKGEAATLPMRGATGTNRAFRYKAGVFAG
jgi:hypothetical protein